MQAIADEQSALVDAGQWTKEAFLRLAPRAYALAGGEYEACTFLLYESDPAWYADLQTLPPEAAP